MKQIILIILVPILAFMVGCAKGQLAPLTQANSYSDVVITKVDRQAGGSTDRNLATVLASEATVIPESTPNLDPKSETPVVTIVSSPSQNKTILDYDFSFLVTNPEAVSTTMCRINTESWRSCTTSFTGHIDRVGIQKFEVMVTSMRGEEITANYEWTVLDEKEALELKEKEEAKVIADQKDRDERAQNQFAEVESSTPEPAPESITTESPADSSEQEVKDIMTNTLSGEQQQQVQNLPPQEQF